VYILLYLIKASMQLKELIIHVGELAPGGLFSVLRYADTARIFHTTCMNAGL